MEILTKICSILQAKNNEIQQYQVRIDEVNQKMEINKGVLDEKDSIINSNFITLNNLKEKCFRINAINNSLQDKLQKFEIKCQEKESQLSQILDEHNSLHAFAQSMKDEYQAQLNNVQMKTKEIEEKKRITLQKTEDDKVSLRNILNDAQKKIKQLELIIEEMKKTSDSQLKNMELVKKAEHNQMREKINEQSESIKSLKIRLNSEQMNKQKLTSNARMDLEKLKLEKRNDANEMEQEYKYTIEMLKTKLENSRQRHQKAQIKYRQISGNSKSIDIQQNKNELDSSISNNEQKKHQMIQHLTKDNEKLKKLRQILLYLKKEESLLKGKINDILISNKKIQTKWDMCSREVDQFEREKNDVVQKQVERTSNLKNKLANAKEILNNIDLTIFTLKRRASDASNQLRSAFSAQKKSNVVLKQVQELNEKMEGKIKELRIEKRNINLRANTPVTFYQSFQQNANQNGNDENSVSSDLDMSTANHSNSSISDFVSFNSSTHSPIIEDLTPLDSPVSPTHGMRFEMNEVKNTLDLLLKQVEEKKAEIEEMKGEESELYKLRELNKELKYKVQHLKEMNEEISNIRAHRFAV